MKRRNIIMVMMMSLLLGSCSSEDILSVPNGNGRIRFDVGVSQSQEVVVTPMNGGATRCAEPLFLPTSSIEMHSGDMTMYANCASTADIPMHNIIPETTTRGSIQTADNFYSTFGIFGYFFESTQLWASINKFSISPESSMNNLRLHEITILGQQMYIGREAQREPHSLPMHRIIVKVLYWRVIQALPRLHIPCHL